MSEVCFLFVLQLTVNSVVDFFRTGKAVDLEVLTSATLSKLEEIKEKTAAGQFLLPERTDLRGRTSEDGPLRRFLHDDAN